MCSGITYAQSRQEGKHSCGGGGGGGGNACMHACNLDMKWSRKTRHN
jgi:hypothetical protein